MIINTTLQYDSEAAAGTGMVINADGLVLTNNHVIDGSTEITATVGATGKTYPATVVGYDKTGDIALIQLQGASGLTTVPIGNSASVKVGNAGRGPWQRRGPGHHHRQARAGHRAEPDHHRQRRRRVDSSETLHGMIQTNADIVPGDSGGPLASSAGVIGMDTAGNDAGYQQAATGFAIPINTALSVARQIAGGPRQLHRHDRLPAVRGNLHSAPDRTAARRPRPSRGAAERRHRRATGAPRGATPATPA